MPFVDHNRLHYRAIGDSGPCVVLIQGLGLSGDFWMEQPERLAALGYRVLVLDNRGFGDSARVTRLYHLGHAAADVIAVLDHAGVDRAVIAGISLGGMIAQQVAFRYPARVQALLLMATTPGLPRMPPLSSLALLLASPALLRTKRGTERLMRVMLARRNWPRAAQLFASWEPIVTKRRADPLSFVLQFIAASTHISTKRLAQIRCPTLIVAADEDAIFPPHIARALQRAIPHSRLRIVEGAGHTLLIEEEHALIEALKELLPSQRAA